MGGKGDLAMIKWEREQRAITIKEVEEAFSTDICKGKINDVAEQLYKLMREEYIDQKQKRTYKCFVTSFRRKL